MTSRRQSDVRRQGALVFALALLCALAATFAGGEPATGVSAKLLGKTDRNPEPSCPRNCLATGSVTAFQREADGKANLFKAKEPGTIVAWAIDLSRPNKSQREFFGKFFENEAFGRAPTAGVAVIRRTGRRKYRLKRESPIVTLGAELGERQTFTLADPLAIAKGDILALTIPTWASNFRGGLNEARNEFRASRRPGKCNSNRDIKEGRPHRTVDTERVYGCDYQGSRLLYWGYYRPN